MIKTKKYIKGLDALRALSIGFVLLNHLGVDVLFFENQYLKNNFYSLFSGETGVRFFFVLSGFLITRILWIQFKDTGTINLKNFFIRRILRLMPPLVLFYVLVISLMQTKFIAYDIEGLLFAFFYLYNYVPLLHYRNELAHIWSLSLEEQFYLIWPFFILVIKKYNVLVVLVLIFIILSVAATISLPEFAFEAHLRPHRWFLPAGGYVAIGATVALIQFKYEKFLLQMFQKNAFALLFAAFLYLIPLFSPVFLVEVFSFLQAIGFGIFVCWIFYNQNSRFVAFLELSPLVYIGKISYGLYVFQGVFLLTGPGSELKFQQFPLNLLLTFGLAILSYHLVEKPILKFKNRF